MKKILIFGERLFRNFSFWGGKLRANRVRGHARAGAALVLLAALFFPGCPVEDEIPTSGSTIKLTNVPAEVLAVGGFGFFAVFTGKDKIGPKKGLLTEPLTGYVPGGLLITPSVKSYWLKDGSSIAVSFGGAITGNKEYVLVLGLAPSSDENTGGTYTTNGTGPRPDTGGGNFSIAGDGPPIDPIVVEFGADGVAEIDFSTNFKNTGTRDELVAGKYN
jgi:hypothetical protein